MLSYSQLIASRSSPGPQNQDREDAVEIFTMDLFFIMFTDTKLTIILLGLYNTTISISITINIES